MRDLDNEGMTQIVVTHHTGFAQDTAGLLLIFQDGQQPQISRRIE